MNVLLMYYSYFDSIFCLMIYHFFFHFLKIRKILFLNIAKFKMMCLKLYWYRIIYVLVQLYFIHMNTVCYYSFSVYVIDLNWKHFVEFWKNQFSKSPPQTNFMDICYWNHVQSIGNHQENKSITCQFVPKYLSYFFRSISNF